MPSWPDCGARLAHGASRCWPSVSSQTVIGPANSRTWTSWHERVHEVHVRGVKMLAICFIANSDRASEQPNMDFVNSFMPQLWHGKDQCEKTHHQWRPRCL